MEIYLNNFSQFAQFQHFTIINVMNNFYNIWLPYVANSATGSRPKLWYEEPSQILRKEKQKTLT